LLRAARATTPERIHHVPKILYHWRAIAGSTARSHGEKHYAQNAGITALREHVAQIEPRASVEPGPHPTTYRVRWPIPDPPPLVSIIIPTRDRVDLLRVC